MGPPALASEDKNACKQSTCIAESSSKPTSTSPISPTLPEPCARPPYTSASRQSASVSSSSAGSSASSTPPSSMELEKASWEKYEIEPRSRESRQSRRSRDPEKYAYDAHRELHPPHGAEMATRITYDDDREDEIDEGRQVQEKKALKTLLFLSGPCVLLSAMNAAWACVAIFVTLLSQPIRLCSKRPTVGQQLAGLLSPTLNLQLRCIYTPLPPYANEDGSYDSWNLFAGHILSPFLSFFVMFAAWIVAIYWATSAAVGDPTGQDKRDDGQETVLGLRKWWEKWLLRGVKNEQ